VSIVAYGLGLDDAGAAVVDLDDVELSTTTIVVELENVSRIVDLPDDLVVSVDTLETSVTVAPDLQVAVDDNENDVELD
jgi:hypothetical protein